MNKETTLFHTKFLVNAAVHGVVLDSCYFFMFTPQFLTAVLNFDNSGWQIENTRRTDGIAGSVENTALSFDAVILPALMRNHKCELVWRLVSSSTACDWVTVTTVSVSSASRNNPSKDFSIFSCLNRSQRGGGSLLAKELGMRLDAWFFTSEKIAGFVEQVDKEVGDAIALEDGQSVSVEVGLRLLHVGGGDCSAAFEPALPMN